MHFDNFNGSIWHVLWILVPLGTLVYLLIFFGLDGEYYFFDPKHNHDLRLKDEGNDYEPHSKRYQDLAKLAITLSAAAIAFLINIVASDKPVAPKFAQRVEAVAPFVAGLFGACIALLVLFMVVQAVWYEEYCHSPDHSTYKRWKYALSTSLGYAGLLSFVLGFMWLAHYMFQP